MLAALDAGAVDFVQKPTALATDRLLEIADELIEKVKAAAEARVRRPVAVGAPIAVRELPSTAAHGEAASTSSSSASRPAARRRSRR